MNRKSFAIFAVLSIVSLVATGCGGGGNIGGTGEVSRDTVVMGLSRRRLWFNPSSPTEVYKGVAVRSFDLGVTGRQFRDGDSNYTWQLVSDDTRSQAPSLASPLTAKSATLLNGTLYVPAEWLTGDELTKMRKVVIYDNSQPIPTEGQGTDLMLTFSAVPE